MIDHESIYTSTGKKLLRHLNVLGDFKSFGKLVPISLQIAPTSRCNLKCNFCSNVNRDKHEDLRLVDLTRFLDESSRLGVKTVEWTGGGDPTQYKYIREVVDYVHHKLHRQQGFITNGIDLVSVLQSDIHHLSWIRVSLNSLDYVDDIHLPEDYKGTLGFSYVMNSGTAKSVKKKIDKYINKYKPSYVRIVPDCQISYQNLASANAYYSQVVKAWGPPYFYQTKTFSHPKRCWWCYCKPFLLHDGFVYPCSSVVLNDTSERSFHAKFRWFAMDKLASMYQEEAIPFDSKDCTNCVFGEQNSILEAVINPEMEAFV